MDWLRCAGRSDRLLNIFLVVKWKIYLLKCIHSTIKTIKVNVDIKLMYELISDIRGYEA